GGEHAIAAALRHFRAVSAFSLGDADGFSAGVDDLETAAAASRVAEAVWLAEGTAAMRAVVEGRLLEGRERMESAFATGRDMQLTNAWGRYVSQRILLHLVEGRLGEIASEI